MMERQFSLTIRSLLFYSVLFVVLGINSLNTSKEFVGLLYIALIVISYLLVKNNSSGFFCVKGLLWGLSLGAAAMSTIFILEFASGFIVINGLSGIASDILILSLGFQVLVAVGEELAFRSYILNNLAAEMRPLWAVTYSSILFSVIHIPSMIYYDLGMINSGIMVVTLLLFSILTSLLFLRFGLLSAIGIHFAWNSLQYNIFSLNPRFVGLLDVDHISSSIISGGSFGPEAGLLMWVVLGVGIVVMLKTGSQKMLMDNKKMSLKRERTI